MTDYSADPYVKRLERAVQEAFQRLDDLETWRQGHALCKVVRTEVRPVPTIESDVPEIGHDWIRLRVPTSPDACACTRCGTVIAEYFVIAGGHGTPKDIRHPRDPGDCEKK